MRRMARVWLSALGAARQLQGKRLWPPLATHALAVDQLFARQQARRLAAYGGRPLRQEIGKRRITDPQRRLRGDLSPGIGMERRAFDRLAAQIPLGQRELGGRIAAIGGMLHPLRSAPRVALNAHARLIGPGKRERRIGISGKRCTTEPGRGGCRVAFHPLAPLQSQAIGGLRWGEPRPRSATIPVGRLSLVNGSAPAALMTLSDAPPRTRQLLTRDLLKLFARRNGVTLGPTSLKQALTFTQRLCRAGGLGGCRLDQDEDERGDRDQRTLPGRYLKRTHSKRIRESAQSGLIYRPARRSSRS